MSDALDALQKTAAQACALIDRLQVENQRLRAENERFTADGIHTCHDQCPRYACVLRRERDTALADVERLRQALRINMHAYGIAQEATDALEALVAERDQMLIDLEEYRRDVEVLTEERDRLKAALVRLRDCDWVITLPDRMDAVREIARKALEAKE